MIKLMLFRYNPSKKGKFMKKYLTLTLFILFFTSCATKIENEQNSTNKKTNSELIKILVEKEKEINSLKLELETYKKVD